MPDSAFFVRAGRTRERSTSMIIWLYSMFNTGLNRLLISWGTYRTIGKTLFPGA